MISQVAGRLVAKEVDRVVVMTAGGVAYEIVIPLTAFETLPAEGHEVFLHTHLVVKEDEWQLFGFAGPFDRAVFRAMLGATGVGPALALSLVSTLSADRLVRAIRERDVVTLQTVPRVGRKKAEQLVLDLADKLDALYDPAALAAGGGTGGPGTEEAVLGLVRLGYARGDAERAVRAAVQAGDGSRAVPDLIRAALGKIAGR